MGDLYERIVAADGRPGIYESNYLKANAPDGTGAFWLKHNVLVPTAAVGAPGVAEFWCVLWEERHGWVPQVWKRAVRLDGVELSSDEVAMRSSVARLTPSTASGELEGEPEVAWDLSWEDELPPLVHLTSDWMYRRSFPRKKVLTPSPHAVFDGAVTVGDRSIDVTGWVGHRNHNWGSEHAHRYAYGGCNLWEDGADLTVEGFSVQVGLVGRVRSPLLTLIRGLRDGVAFGRGSAPAMLRQAGVLDFPEWTAWAGTRGGSRVRLEMRLDPRHAAGLRYLHPDGRVSYCYNVKDARVDLLLGGDERHNSSAGELEFLVPEPLDGIALHGESTLAELVASAG